MDRALEDLGWTEEQWNRIYTAVKEEAQKARVAAQVLPVVGPVDPDEVAIPRFALTAPPLPAQDSYGAATERLAVNSNPTLNLTTISINVYLRGHEVADPALTAALIMFRRAANYLARLEDALIFNGRSGAPIPQINAGFVGIPPVFTVSADGPAAEGLFVPVAAAPAPRQIALPVDGDTLVSAIANGIGALEGRGQLGPFACILSPGLFAVATTPTANLVLPRDRILPFLQGPLLRASTALVDWGAIVALSANPVEIVLASDIRVQFIHKTAEPRCVFRVGERVALRIKQWDAVERLFVTGQGLQI